MRTQVEPANTTEPDGMDNAQQQTQPNTTENRPSTEERPAAARRPGRDIDEAEAYNNRPVGVAWHYHPP